MMLNLARILRYLFVWAVVFLLHQQVLQAGVTVYPTFVFINAPARATSIVVTNNSSVASEIWIDFRYGYPVGDDSGNVFIKFFDTTDVGEQSAVQWIRAFPQRFVLEAQESQKIRVLLSPPPGLASREYWARLIIHSKDKETFSTTTTQRGQLRSGIKLLTNVDIPVHYRSGQASTGIILQNLETQVNGGTLFVLSDLARSGNASFWGMYKAVLRDQGGKVVLTKEQNIAVYQNLRYGIKIDVSKLRSGTYTLEIEISSQRRDIRREFLLTSEAVRRNINITIP